MGGDPAVRAHRVLVVVAARPPDAPCRQEAQRRRNTVQHLWRERPTKADQHASLGEIDSCGRRHRQLADYRLWRHMREGRSNRPNPPPQPTDGAGQGNIRSTQRIGCGLHALGRRCHRDAVLDRSEQTRQPGSEKVRQEAERSTALRAVPPSDAQPARRHPGVTTMTGKRAPARRMQGAARQSGVAPFSVPDVRIDARKRPQRNLHGVLQRAGASPNDEKIYADSCRLSSPANAATSAGHSR